jgi:hypothetical protein
MAGTLTVNRGQRQLCGIEFPDRGRDVLLKHGAKSPARLNGGTMPVVEKLVFRIPAVALLAAGVAAICATPFAFAAPGLQAIYLLPVAFAGWVVRNRTTVDASRLVARSTFGKRTVAWDDVKAIKVEDRAWLSAVLSDDTLVRLPAVRTMHLPALSMISGGRIPDPTPKPAGPADSDPVEPAAEPAQVEAPEHEDAERTQ